ncbi:MAG: UDP-N-acetylmuramoyl-tripeptide--D-alanyl-D-alanine ligase [Lachnospiraceae bacterium]|nr:UDP-N-acetylmuramoyl-tripeptide--D-alanyl-D-alanine ligase [Lachnospiraceae bacterium]MCM1237784.1 UDP-N-acetylmuramoyl-tripeptide--D-alanyl-D-alanine ligase [Lachnospiraceae bacterium]
MTEVMDLTLGEIAASAGGQLVLQKGAQTDTCVSSVAIDSRLVTEGGVFLATIGERVDGHRFIASVFEKGAALAVTQKTPEQVEAETGVLSEEWGSYLLVEDTLQALKDIAEAYRRKFSIPVVGITGSVGKTSTKEFIAGVLSEKYHVLKTDGNHNNEIGVPLTLLGIRGEHTAAVVEMGISDFGEMHRLSKMARPDICVITNIGQCHLENLKTRDGILKAKSEIFDHMAEDGQVCLYGGDDKLATLTEIRGRRPHFFGWGDYPLEEVTAGNVVSHGLWGSDAELTIRKYGSGQCDCVPVSAQAADTVSAEAGAAAFTEEKITVHVPLPGRHMVLNSAAAACVAGLLGITPEQIGAGIRKIRPVNGRNNLIRLKEYTLIDDCYNANPASMKAAIDLLAMADTEKTAILGDMFELGEDSRALHEETGAYAASAGIDRICCVGREAEYMYRAASMSAASAQVMYFPAKQDLLQELRTDLAKYVPKGSTVLIKASHGMEFTEIVELFKSLDN